VIERMHLNAAGYLQIDMRIEDPKALMQPWEFTRLLQEGRLDDRRADLQGQTRTSTTSRAPVTDFKRQEVANAATRTRWRQRAEIPLEWRTANIKNGKRIFGSP